MQEFLFFLSDKKKEKKLKTDKYIGARIASTRDMLNISFPFFYIIHIYEMYELYN